MPARWSVLDEPLVAGQFAKPQIQSLARSLMISCARTVRGVLLGRLHLADDPAPV